MGVVVGGGVLTLSVGSPKLGELPRIWFGCYSGSASPDRAAWNGLWWSVCGCLLRTQQCVELCFGLVVLCQFDVLWFL